MLKIDRSPIAPAPSFNPTHKSIGGGQHRRAFISIEIDPSVVMVDPICPKGGAHGWGGLEWILKRKPSQGLSPRGGDDEGEQEGDEHDP